MSLVFSAPTTRSGICELIDKRINTTTASYPITDKVVDINLAKDRYLLLALRAGGVWQVDDTNQTDYPIITTNLVSGQRDYTFNTDGTGNLVLDIYRVLCADSSGYYREINPVDQQTQNNNNTNTDTFVNGQNSSGTPTRYDKTGNSIFLDLIPNYNYTNGLKVYINRETTYFTAADTTKKSGLPGLLDEYLVVRPAWQKAASIGLPQAGGRLRNGAYTGLAAEVQNLEDAIISWFSTRGKDDRRRIGANVENTR